MEMRMRDIITIVEASGTKSLGKSKGRSTTGGEIGVNGYFYKGGQFLPSTDTPPGMWKMNIKGKNKNVPKANELIAAGKLEVQPTPYSRAIYGLINLLVNDNADGTIALNTNLNPIAIANFGRDIRPGVKGMLGTQSYDVEELIDLYNRGARWIDVKPEGVE